MPRHVRGLRSASRPGATWDGKGTQFVLRAPDADAVVVEIFETSGSGRASRRIALRRTVADRWCAYEPGVGPGTLYGYRVDGPFRPQEGHRFNAAKLLVDPWARAVAGAPRFDASLFGFRAEGGTESFDGGDSAAACPKCVVVDNAFDWQGDAPPRIPWRESVIYECHVRGMTMLHPDVPPEHRGRYLGLASSAVIAHLERLGVTAVELLPVAQFATESSVARRGLVNYWGYSPLAFCAPHAGYASDDVGAQVREFKAMVRALHSARIEVILDVVLNHTAEGGAEGPTLSWRGLANAAFYRLDPRNRRRCVDWTGCGNTYDLSSPLACDLALDALRVWVEDMHVDGFRFDLATTLGRRGSQEHGTFASDAPFFAALDADPVLSRVKRIAEPWDLGPDGYQHGRFPKGWAEWNDRFRDDARRAWLIENQPARNVARSLCASRPATAINFVACHDGMTLADVVAYADKHNQANGEANRDGNDHEIRSNHGVEGPTDDPNIVRRRRNAVANLLITLLVADDVPMIAHGDELGRSQRGNNNAYCQDNEISWIDWQGVDDRRLDLVTRLTSLRRRWRRRQCTQTASTSIVWMRPDGTRFASAEAVEGAAFVAATDLWRVLVNLDTTAVPFARAPGSWQLVVCSADPPELEEAAGPMVVGAQSMICLEAIHGVSNSQTSAASATSRETTDV